MAVAIADRGGVRIQGSRFRVKGSGRFGLKIWGLNKWTKVCADMILRGSDVKSLIFTGYYSRVMSGTYGD